MPTFVQEAESAWDVTISAATTTAFDAVAGQWLVTIGGHVTGSIAQTISNSGTALDWILALDASAGSFPRGTIWTHKLVEDVSSQTVTCSTASGSGRHGVNTMTFTDTDGPGATASATASTAIPSVSITTTQDNSSLLVANFDALGVNGDSRGWLAVDGDPPVEVTYIDTGTFAAYLAYYVDAGPAGPKTVGLTAPDFQQARIVAVELVPAVVPPTPEQTDLITLTAAT